MIDSVGSSYEREYLRLNQSIRSCSETHHYQIAVLVTIYNYVDSLSKDVINVCVTCPFRILNDNLRVVYTIYSYIVVNRGAF